MKSLPKTVQQLKKITNLQNLPQTIYYELANNWVVTVECVSTTRVIVELTLKKHNMEQTLISEMFISYVQIKY